MKKRYYVEPIDNCGSVAGLKRDRTWAVMDRHTGKQVCEYDTRVLARSYADSANSPEDTRWAARDRDRLEQAQRCEADQIANESLRGEALE